MERRTFFGSMCAAIAGVFGLGKVQAGIDVLPLDERGKALQANLQRLWDGQAEQLRAFGIPEKTITEGDAIGRHVTVKQSELPWPGAVADFAELILEFHARFGIPLGSYVSCVTVRTAEGKDIRIFRVDCGESFQMGDDYFVSEET